MLLSGKEGQRQGVPKEWGSEMQPSITMCSRFWGEMGNGRGKGRGVREKEENRLGQWV